MKVGIIITNPTPDNPAGEHPADKLALACSEKLIQIDPSMMEGDRIRAAIQLQMDIMDALAPHIDAHAKATKQEVISNSEAHFMRGDLHDPGPQLATTIKAVKAAAKGTPWEEQFNTKESEAIMHSVIGQFLVDAAHLERLYHADRTPSDEHARRYKMQPTGIAVLPVIPVGLPPTPMTEV